MAVPCTFAKWKPEMSRLISFAEIGSLGFTKRRIVHAFSLHLLRGYRIRTNKTRLISVFKSFKWSYGSHNFSSKVLGQVSSCNDADMFEGPKFADNVSVLLGYDGINDMVEHNESTGKVEFDTCLANDCNLLLACEKFSSISLGDSSLIKLYNSTYQTDGVYTSFDLCKHVDGWSSINSKLLNASFSTYIEKTDKESDTSQMKSLADGKHSNPDYLEEHSPLRSVTTGISSISELAIDRSIRCIPGMTNRQYCDLENAGFYTVRKLLQHFPRTYADLRNVHGAIEDGQYLILVGTILSSRARTLGTSLSIHEVKVKCNLAEDEQELNSEKETFSTGNMHTVFLHLKKFFRGIRFINKSFLQHIQSKYNKGDRIYITGKVKKMDAEGHYEMKDYSVDMLEKTKESDCQMDPRPYSIYPSKAGLKPDFLRGIISRALQLIPEDVDPLPDDILKEFSLLNLRDTYYGIHCPRRIDEAGCARRRLIFDEFFYLQLARLFRMLEPLGTLGERECLLEKYRKQTTEKTSMDGWSDLTKKFLQCLPFSLTPSQVNAASEIIWDLKRPVPMNRLLQGEVGSGKTVVAFLACMEVIASGFQAAFMVPTELLAIQHYEKLLGYMENISDDQEKPSIALLTGSTSAKKSRAICQGLQNGDISMVIGTHSLTAEKINFCALRFAIIDEQHRFGVIQRGKFNSKLYSCLTSLNALDSGKLSSDGTHMSPHVLAMSATPIPRTLALTIYGDVSLTRITGSLPGRASVETYALEGNENGFNKVYEMMRNELDGGGKVYLVYPVIDESEQLPQLHAASKELEFISAKFEGYQCGLLHGRMNSAEKDNALRQFRSGNVQVLLSTQVIEIGIDVPDASMIVVMNAERFGIAQLHQLRGRVGRGTNKSRCIFISSTASGIGRLKVLETSNDGFFLAKMDLIFRGPGDLLGKKQSGHLPEFPITRLEIDGNILQEAHKAALEVLRCSTDLEKFPKLKAELSMRQPLSLLGD